MILFLILIAISIIFVIYEIIHAGRCCGDCHYFDSCHGKIYSRDNLETPACENFQENIIDK